MWWFSSHKHFFFLGAVVSCLGLGGFTIALLLFKLYAWLRDNKLQALECKVEHLLKESRHDILWMSTYGPDLQPVEHFWAEGKGRAVAR
jgi:hypothetical protein